MSQPVLQVGPVVDEPGGLTDTEVAARIASGQLNGRPAPVGRTIPQIVRANVVTRFNLLLGGLFAAAIAVGAAKDTLFIWVVIVNLAIGIGQELRTRRTLRDLTIVSAAPVRVRRNHRRESIAPSDIVADEVMFLGRGEQVPVDATVLTGPGFDLDESLITGESDPCHRGHGAVLTSGSVVLAGSGLVRATKIGDHAYARRLSQEARQFSLAGSDLRAGTDRILRAITWVLLPVGALLLWSQLHANETIASAVQGTIAGVSAMVPEGLVLLTSLAFAAGATRLGQRRVLTRELAAVEGLARVDVVLVDKTGTLTEPGMTVVAVDAGPDYTYDQIAEALAAFAAADADPNPTVTAIATAYPKPPSWSVTSQVPFTSARAWSATTFAGHGTWLLGAPEALLPGAATVAAIVEHRRNGARTVVLARTTGVIDVTTRPADDIELVAVVALSEKIKRDVSEVVRYLGEQGVAVKVVSGDNPQTVGAVAEQAGLGRVEAIDGRLFPDDSSEFTTLITSHDVFGRVTPEQKRRVVQALQASGHTVAMTGDGVNDLLALKQADVGIAMGHGSPATKAVAQFVLLDGSFDSLPAIIAEGRRVIGNVERVASLFVTKTAYALILALATGVARLPFPLLARQLSLVGALTIGLPSFLLALEPNHARATRSFVRRVCTIALPAGTLTAVSTFIAYADARADGATLAQARTTATVVLFVVASGLLARIARPWRPRRLALLGSMTLLFALAMTLPGSTRYFDVVLPPTGTWITSGLLAAGACAALYLGPRVLAPLSARRRAAARYSGPR